MADEEAKTAAKGFTTEATSLPRMLRKPLKQNKSAAKQAHNSKLKVEWRRGWQISPRAQRLKHIDSSLPSSKFLKLTSNPDMSRKGASWLYQIRTGHFPLNAYLHRFKRAENTGCPACGHSKETPQHLVLDCPAYAHERWPLIKGKSQKNKEFAALIGKPKNAIDLINFIQATGRLAGDGTWKAGGNRRDRANGGRGEAAGEGVERETHADIQTQP